MYMFSLCDSPAWGWGINFHPPSLSLVWTLVLTVLQDQPGARLNDGAQTRHLLALSFTLPLFPHSNSDQKHFPEGDKNQRQTDIISLWPSGNAKSTIQCVELLKVYHERSRAHQTDRQVYNTQVLISLMNRGHCVTAVYANYSSLMSYYSRCNSPSQPNNKKQGH